MDYNTKDYSDNLKEKINRDLISITIEKILIDFCEATYLKVVATLAKDYHSTFYDFYENPEFLTRILKDLYGESHTAILDKIKTDLQRYVVDKEISDFIKNIME